MLYGRDAYAGDEVPLAEIWNALVRHKLLISTIVIVFASVGIVHSLFSPLIYEYTTVIEVGTRYSASRSDLEGRLELIEPIETVRAKVAGGYIAQVLQEHYKKTSDARRYAIKVEVPKNSQIIILESKGAADSEAIYISLHETVVDRIRQDHFRAQEALHKDLEARLDMQQRSLAELRQQAQLFDAQLKRLEGKSELPARELSYLTSLRLADNQRAQAEIVGRIDAVRLQLANLRETRAAVSPMRSFEPVGLSRELKVFLWVTVGLLVGAITALVLAFARSRRERPESVGSGPTS